MVFFFQHHFHLQCFIETLNEQFTYTGGRYYSLKHTRPELFLELTKVYLKQMFIRSIPTIVHYQVRVLLIFLVADFELIICPRNDSEPRNLICGTRLYETFTDKY